MDRLKKATLISEMLDRITAKGSWAGETHLQMCLFLLQEMREVPTGYFFQIYRYGPYSFDLHDEIIQLRGDRIVSLVPRKYGSSLKNSRISLKFRKHFPKTLEKYSADMDFIAEHFGNLNADGLGVLATAYYFILQDKASSDEEIAKKVKKAKPYISILEGIEVTKKVREIAESKENRYNGGAIHEGNYGMALKALHATRCGLTSLLARLLSDREEQLEREQGDNDVAVFASAIRFGWACAHVQYTVEVALKALIHLDGGRQDPDRRHDLNALCSDLPEPHRRAVRSWLSEETADEITRWHTGTRRGDDGRADDPTTPELVKEFTRAGCAVAAYTARQFGDEVPDARRVLDLVETLENRLVCYDLLTGLPIEGRLDQGDRAVAARR